MLEDALIKVTAGRRDRDQVRPRHQEGRSSTPRYDRDAITDAEAKGVLTAEEARRACRVAD